MRYDPYSGRWASNVYKLGGILCYVLQYIFRKKIRACPLSGFL